MRILTWNVNFRTAECLDGIRGLYPDVLLLQEVKHRTVDGFAARLRDDGLPHSTYSGTVSDKQKRYGNVIASRWPISPGVRGWARGLRWPQLAHRATVHAPDGDLDAINVHIPNGSGNGWDKVYALEAVANAIARSADVRRVLAGDFNEPQTIRPDGTVVSWGQLIGRDGSVRFGRRAPTVVLDPHGSRTRRAALMTSCAGMLRSHVSSTPRATLAYGTSDPPAARRSTRSRSRT